MTYTDHLMQLHHAALDGMTICENVNCLSLTPKEYTNVVHGIRLCRLCEARSYGQSGTWQIAGGEA